MNSFSVATFRALCVLCLSTSVWSQLVEKVTALNYSASNGLSAKGLTVFNDRLYFFGTLHSNYNDWLLWTDGTKNEVHEVKQIDTIRNGQNLMYPTVANNHLVFWDRATKELWSSDGTEAGTIRLATLENPIYSLTAFNSQVYFVKNIGSGASAVQELWSTDGTIGATRKIKTLNSHGLGMCNFIATYHSKLYFYAGSDTGFYRLWSTDGTESGTTSLITAEGVDAGISYSIVFQDKLIFRGAISDGSQQLWISDGTQAGTHTLYVNNHGRSYCYGLYPGFLTEYKGKIYFSGRDTMAYAQLYESDGTTTGTRVFMRADSLKYGFDPQYLCVVGDRLYFGASDTTVKGDSPNRELWSTDGTKGGTRMETKVGMYGLQTTVSASYHNHLVMQAYDANLKTQQLFVFDPSTSKVIEPTPPDTWSTYPFGPFEGFVPYHDALYYVAAYSYFADYQICRYSDKLSDVGDTEQDLTGNNNVVLSPQPASSSLHIHSLSPLPLVRVEIYNSLATLSSVQQCQDIDLYIDLSALAPGVYLLITEHSDGSRNSMSFVHN